MFVLVRRSIGASTPRGWLPETKADVGTVQELQVGDLVPFDQLE